MHFAAPFPLWLAVLAVVAIIAVAVFTYRRPLVPLPPSRRLLLAALRAIALALLVLFLARPTILVPPATASDLVVPVLVDASRSMRVTDSESGASRLEVAKRLLNEQLLPSLSRRFKPELFAVGDGLTTTTADGLSADARRSDLSGAIEAIKARYRGRPIAGVVLVSDGADTELARADGNPLGDQRSAGDGRDAGRAQLSIFPIGIGTSTGVPDREVVGVSAGDARLDAATVDLRVTAVSRGFGREPFQLRVLADGRVIDTRTLTPAADGSPVDAEFTVLPNPVTSTVYSAEIAAATGEAIVENNQRSVLVNPAGRKRRILAIEGSPGYDHSFLARALAADSGLDLDIIVRKGRNDAGDETYYVQAGGGRAPQLTSGFPATREGLFGYDAVIIANMESDYFTKAQLQMTADFVAERGGGLLVFGSRSFDQRGLINTPLEEVLPVELNDRRGGLARASLDTEAIPKHHAVTLTSDGERHPIMRLGATVDDTRKAWTALPALASAAALGGPRAGAKILAVTSTGGGVVVPLVAVQRYGRGRSMLFAGEGAWRWKMLMSSSDRSYEFFWRQALRWLSTSAPAPVDAIVPDAAEPGDSVTLAVDARDAAFVPVPDATVAATLTNSAGETRPLTLRREVTGNGAPARFTASFRPEQAGLYRLRAEAMKGTTELGVGERWFYVGGGDREFADPRLNEGVLRRLARASGGRFAAADEVGQVAGWLEASAPPAAEPEPRDLWHEPWAFLLLIAILSAEWIFRRRWGLR